MVKHCLFLIKRPGKHSFYIYASNINHAFTLHKALGWQLGEVNGERQMI